MAGHEPILERAKPLLLVALGGFAGAVCRYGVALALPGPVPWATLVANVTGSFALGVLLYERRLADRVSAEARLVAGAGFLSSFTTYSTFALETTELASGLAAANVAGNYALGLAAVVCGRAVARWVA